MMNEEEIVFNLQNILMSSRVTQVREENTIREVCSLFTKRAPIMKKFSEGRFPCCPHCGGHLSERHYKCCPDCGQKINWVEYEERSKEPLNVDISSLDISIRAYSILKNNNINTIGDLLNTSVLQLLAFKNISMKDVDNIIGAVKLYNIDIDKWEYELDKEKD